jgi:hypothetical protein
MLIHQLQQATIGQEEFLAKLREVAKPLMAAELQPLLEFVVAREAGAAGYRYDGESGYWPRARLVCGQGDGGPLWAQAVLALLPEGAEIVASRVVPLNGSLIVDFIAAPPTALERG